MEDNKNINNAVKDFMKFVENQYLRDKSWSKEDIEIFANRHGVQISCLIEAIQSEMIKFCVTFGLELKTI